MRCRASRVLSLVAVLVPALALGQFGPAGSEFQVNSYTDGDQSLPAVSSDADGDFVVVWQSRGQGDSDYGIFGQRYSSSGAPAGAEFLVNSYTTGRQRSADVSSDADGDFVVVWERFRQYDSNYGIFGQRYSSSGAPAGGEFRVSSYTSDRQRGADVSSDADGDFVVVWQSYRQDGSNYGIFGQRYSSSGATAGGEFLVNSYTVGSQGASAVSSDSDGDFVVVWTSYRQDGSSFGIFGQRYSRSGAPAGAEFLVNSYTTGGQSRPAVGSDADGDVVVVWNRNHQDDLSYEIFGQRYRRSGAPAGGEFRVNSHTPSIQGDPALSSDADGDFVVVWESILQDGLGWGIFGQRYRRSGAPAGGEFRVNSFTDGDQESPAVSSDADGDFVVVWHSDGQKDGSDYGIFGQRMTLSSPGPTQTPTPTPTPNLTPAELGSGPGQTLPIPALALLLGTVLLAARRRPQDKAGPP